MGVLEDMWVESFGSTNDIGAPQDQRKEMGGWMIKDGGGNLSFQPFPSDLEASICTIQKVPPPPAGAVAVIHTHPVIPTERIKEASCIESILDGLGINDSLSFKSFRLGR